MFQTPAHGSLSLTRFKLRPERSSVCHFGRLRNAEDHRNGQFRELYARSESTCVLPMEGQCPISRWPGLCPLGQTRYQTLWNCTSHQHEHICDSLKEVRGGDLKISATMQSGGISATGKSHGLKLVGTNPSIAILRSIARPKKAFRKLMRLESASSSFLRTDLRSLARITWVVGLCQITHPSPTDDEVWSWKANVKKGWEIYQVKEKVARDYPRGSSCQPRLCSSSRTVQQCEV